MDWPRNNIYQVCQLITLVFHFESAVNLSLGACLNIHVKDHLKVKYQGYKLII